MTSVSRLTIVRVDVLSAIVTGVTSHRADFLGRDHNVFSDPFLSFLGSENLTVPAIV